MRRLNMKSWLRDKIYNLIQVKLDERDAALQKSILDVSCKLRNVQEEQNELRKQMKNMFNELRDVDFLRERVRNNNRQLEQLVVLQENIQNNSNRLKDIERLEENVRHNNKKWENIEALEENIRNNNSAIQKLETNIDMQTAQISILKKRTDVSIIETYVGEDKDKTHDFTKNDDNTYKNIDYFDLENKFRGSREQVKQAQKQYIKFFKDCKNVIDLGSGRGEFLELLKENGIDAIGIELYDEFVQLCENKELKVIQEDAISYLGHCKTVDGIFAAQVVEHLPIDSVMELCKLAYEKLTKGGYMILETPNPMSVAIFTHSFYMDPSHNKPVHPLTLKYMAEKAGFRDINILYTDNSRLPGGIPELESKCIDNLERFNQSMKEVSDMLYGSQDYALIARK